MSLREAMPLTAAFIDECREAFGADHVNAQIRLGMQGAQTFYACENGHEVGTRCSDPVRFVSGDDLVIRENAGLVMAMVAHGL